MPRMFCHPVSFKVNSTILHRKIPQIMAKPYKILTEDDIRQLLDDDVSTISDALSVSRGTACTLLCRNNWNLTSAGDQYFAADQNPQFSAAARELGQIACNICYDELSSESSMSAACGHPFCVDCWRAYVEAAITDGPRCLKLSCPEPGCGAAAGIELVEPLASAGAREKYYGYLRRSYVEWSRWRKWCPAAGCGFAVEFDGGGGGGGGYDVICGCSHGFCWNCGAEQHHPAGCESWIESEAANTRWIMANTKPCPKCLRRIEKNQGCNWMRCSGPCHFQFCWLCSHSSGYHRTCNYKE